MRCSGCKAAHCGHDCHRSDWEYRKIICPALKDAAIELEVDTAFGKVYPHKPLPEGVPKSFLLKVKTLRIFRVEARFSGK